MPVPLELAARPVIAVMIDDSAAARPQSGLAAASVVIQAPAEGGIPRYLAFFQSGDATAIGPIRSARRYFVAWASEWRALYAHVGGSDEATAYLPTVNGKLVFDADEFRYGGTYMWRITERVAPHNVYSTTAVLRGLAAQLRVPAPDAPHWTFAPDPPLSKRPVGGSLTVPYSANLIAYTYDRERNRYLRSSGGQPQVDAADGSRVAPANVVILFMSVGRDAVGRVVVGYRAGGRAIVAHDGLVVAARWTKASDAAPTLLWQVDAAGKATQVPVTLTRGQTFVQVVPIGTAVTALPGQPPPPDPGGYRDPQGLIAY